MVACGSFHCVTRLLGPKLEAFAFGVIGDSFCLFVNGADIQFFHDCLVLQWLCKGRWNSIDVIEISMGTMSGVCPALSILLRSSFN